MNKNILVVPYHQGDRHLVESLATWLHQLSGGNQIGEEILFCASPTATDDHIGRPFVDLFQEVKFIQQSGWPNVPAGQAAWPFAPNQQFAKLAHYMSDERKDVSAFYWFEPDNLPLKRDWYQQIWNDYRLHGKPFWGIQAPNVEGDSINGHHMIGTGIYPRDAWERIPKFREIEKENHSAPFDVWCREQVNPLCHFTDLAMHCADMRDYQPDGTAYYPKHFIGRARYSLTIPKQTCVLHGCKDFSLRHWWGSKMGLPQN